MTQAVILAAGESSRFWPLNFQHKSLFRIMGKPLIFYSIESVKRNGIREIIIIQSPKRDAEMALSAYRSLLAGVKIRFIIQPKPLGTGNAVLKAEKFIEGHFLVLNAERIDACEHLDQIFRKGRKNNFVVLASKTKTPGIFGILKARKDKLLEIVEKPQRNEAPSDLKNVGLYFLPKHFFSILRKFTPHPYSLVQAITFCAQKENVAIAFSEKPTVTLKYPWDLFQAKKYLMNNYLKKSIAPSAKISKEARIEGRVVIGANASIAEAVIRGPCFIGDNAVVGSKVSIRAYSDIEQNVSIGSFSDIGNSVFQPGVQTQSGVFQDSIFDEDCWLGAGITVKNRTADGRAIKTVVKGERISTGIRKFGVVIGKGTKVGAKVTFLPGVMVGRNCIIPSGFRVSKNIEDSGIPL